MSNHRLRPALLLSLLAIVSPPALALQPLITDDTGTQGSGGNQIELAYSGFRQKMSGSKCKWTLPLFAVAGRN